jgi:hypothetical protein
MGEHPTPQCLSATSLPFAKRHCSPIPLFRPPFDSCLARAKPPRCAAHRLTTRPPPPAATNSPAAAAAARCGTWRSSCRDSSASGPAWQWTTLSASTRCQRARATAMRAHVQFQEHRLQALKPLHRVALNMFLYTDDKLFIHFSFCKGICCGFSLHQFPQFYL